jgi:hypothetical protein
MTDEKLWQKFWAKVQWTPTCWLWRGALSRAGYGNVSRRGRTTTAHRLAYERLVGPVPEGLYVCHRCDNPCCVNPWHLFVGTNSDNLYDAARKSKVVQAAIIDGLYERKERP